MSRMDLREALAGLLTLSMFIMLGNMIKKDHFDSINVDLPTTAVSRHASALVTGQSLATISHIVKGRWKEKDEGLKPCWDPPLLKEAKHSKGSVTFSLTNGPEYQISQIADAVVTARYLGATLMLPEIKDSKLGYSLSLGDIYDVQNVLNGLEGLVRVPSTQPTQVSNTNLPTIRVPNRVSEDYIVKKVLLIYKAKGIVKIESYFPSVGTIMARNNMNLDSIACQAMFGTLQLRSEIQEVLDPMVQKLQTLSHNLNASFLAVDLRTEVFAKECHKRDDKRRKLCYKAQEIGEFLKKIGFGQETVIYVTLTKWSSDLDAFRDIFPKTYTKESVMPTFEKGKFRGFETSEFEKIIDFYICSQSDVFVPSIPDLFYTNVTGMRIASGKKKILVPDEKASPSASFSDYISPYVSKKSHFADSCFC